MHLTGVSVYSGYYSSGGAGGAGGFEMAVQNPFLTGPSAMAGVAATFGGSKSAEKSTFTWSYSPSYFNSFYGNNQFSNNGSLNHRMSVHWTRKLGSKWTLSGSLNGYLANLEQLYFNPGVLSSVASLPTTFDDLAAGMLAGQFTDAQLASLLYRRATAGFAAAGISVRGAGCSTQRRVWGYRGRPREGRPCR